MIMLGFIRYLAVVGYGFKTKPAIVGFDQLFEVVNVDELDVELVVEVFNLGELFLGEGLVRQLLELAFAFVDLIAQGTK